MSNQRKELFRNRDEANLFMDFLQNVTGISSDPKFRAADRNTRMNQARSVRGLLEAFMGYADAPKSARVQAFWKSSDLPQPVSDAYDMLTDVANYDDGWMAAFQDSSNRIAPGTDYWEVATVGQGSVWVAIPEGEKVNLRKITGSLEAIKVSKYGDGIAFSDELIRFRKIGPMIDLITDFRDGYARSKANAHYDLLDASAGGTTNPVAAVGDSDLESDIKTLNECAYTILNNVKNTRNVSTMTPLILYANPQAQARVNRALGELSQAYSGSTRRISYNIVPIYTFNENLPAASSGNEHAMLMVLPGYKNQTATLMQPTSFNDTDILSLSFIQTSFAYWGAGCLDGNQIRKVELR